MVSLNQLVVKNKLALESAIENNNLVEEVLKECNKDLRKLYKILKCAPNMGVKRNVGNIVCHLKGTRSQMKILRNRVGSGLRQPNRNIQWIDVECAFDSRMRTGCIVNLGYKDPKKFLEGCCKLFTRRIKNALKKVQMLKVNAVFCGEFKTVKAMKEVIEHKYINTKNGIIDCVTDLDKWFNDNILEKILKDLEEFQERDSGWALSSIINLTININKYTPQIGSSFVELPKRIALKKACINVRNNDDKCFKWAVLSALYPTERDAGRVQKYQQYADELNFSGINFPVTLKQIPR